MHHMCVWCLRHPEEDMAMDHLEQEFRLAVSLPEVPAWVVSTFNYQSVAPVLWMYIFNTTPFGLLQNNLNHSIAQPSMYLPP